MKFIISQFSSSGIQSQAGWDCRLGSYQPKVKALARTVVLSEGQGSLASTCACVHMRACVCARTHTHTYTLTGKLFLVEFILLQLQN